jgi:hypothetical protein
MVERPRVRPRCAGEPVRPSASEALVCIGRASWRVLSSFRPRFEEAVEMGSLMIQTITEDGCQGRREEVNGY